MINAQFRKNIILCTDIMPDEIYLTSYAGRDHPCRIVCNNDSGWKRGCVDTTQDSYGHLYATAVFVDTELGTKLIKLDVRKDQIGFTDICNTVTLKKMTSCWMAERTEKLKDSMNEAQKELELLKTMAVTR